MPGRAYGDVVTAGRKTIEGTGMDRRGPSNKNLGPSANRQASPKGAIRSTGQQVRGPDKGAGGR